MAAVTADKVVVELELKDGQYLAKVRRNEEQFTKSQRNSARAAEDAERRIRASSDGISRAFKSVAASLAAGASVAAITKMADNYTNLQNRLKATGLEGQALIDVQDRLYEAANKNGIAVDAVAQLYQRATLAQKSLGASTDEIISLTNGVAAALRVQGVSAEQASGPLLQLGQALGAGTVRAEELNSLLEGTPILLQAAANGSAKYAGDMNALAAAVRKGEVSSQELFRAMLAGLPAIQAQAEQLPKTVGQAMQILNNQLGRYVGQADQGLSATQRLAAGIEGLANNLDKVVPAIAVLSGVFAARYVASLAAAALAEDGFITKARQAVAETVANERAKTAAVAQGARARTAALTAESIALRRQVDTGRTATGQFVSRVAAQKQLDAANKALISSFGTATAATVRNTGAMTVATSAAKSLGGGLLALAGGPVIAAITGLALAISLVVNANINAKREFDNLESSVQETAKEYERAAAAAKSLGSESGRLATTQDTAAVSAAQLTGEVSKLADEHYRAAAGVKAQIVETLRLKALTAGQQTSEAVTQFRNVQRQAEFRETRRDPASRARVNDELLATREFAVMQTAASNARIATAELRAEMERPLSAYLPTKDGGTGNGGEDGAGRVGSSARAAAKDIVDSVSDIEIAFRRIEESLLTDAERAAKQLAEQAEIINAAVSAGIITPTEGARVAAGVAGLGLEEFKADDITPISPEVAQEYGRMLAEGAAAEVEAWRGMARNFTDVLASDNIWEAAGHKFRDAAFNHLEDVLTNLFAGLSKSGGGWGSIFGMFGGNRATGGPVRAGMSYNVGERGTEKFVPSQNGYIIPNMKNASAAPGMSGMVKIVVGEGEMFTARVTEIAGPLSIQTAATSAAYSQDQMVKSQKRSGQRIF